MQGYHIDWKRKNSLMDSKSENLTIQEKKIEVSKTVSDSLLSGSIDNSSENLKDKKSSDINQNSFSASLDKFIPVLNKDKKVQRNNISVGFVKSFDQKGIKKAERRIKRIQRLADSNSQGDGMGVLSVFGWILISIGFLILLFASIVGGAILMLLGLLFVLLIGKKNSDKSNNNSKTTNKNSNNSNQLIDVVYLKNGGSVRGMIIEQIPNVQLKIQTNDGSVFVYKFEEIEKMTKEQMK